MRMNSIDAIQISRELFLGVESKKCKYSITCVKMVFTSELVSLKGAIIPKTGWKAKT